MKSGESDNGTSIIVLLRPSAALRVAGSRANLRPLIQGHRGEELAFGIGAEPQWFLADLPDAMENPWDLAHHRVADQLGVAGSDVLFAEPDIVHNIYPDPQWDPGEPPLGAAPDCTAKRQSDKNGKATGPHDKGWHLDDDYSQLRLARAAVEFEAPFTRIAHLDTGYSRSHVSHPKRVLTDLERSFAKGEEGRTSAEDPDRDLLVLDNSGHGTGTLSILAGVEPPGWGDDQGGAPEAEIIPLRIADSVVLLRSSAFASALEYAIATGCDVVTMSMGGLPSETWKHFVDQAYKKGVCVVSAAGNNFGGLPTRNLVYPARYNRVIAVCGIMADGKPYTGLKNREMEGNYGPKKKMKAAMAAYTPNIPWAAYGCDQVYRLNGGGTSSATPQVAAAAALWFEKYKSQLPRDWRRVEAVRHALFSSADDSVGHPKRLGHGALQAADALKIQPVLDLKKTKSDRDWLALFRVLTGLGVTEPTPREEMFNLELAQRWMVSEELQKIFPTPEDMEEAGEPDKGKLREIMDAVIEDPDASLALRKHLVSRYPLVSKKPPPSTPASRDVVPVEAQACDPAPPLTNPPFRRLRIYAGDPSLSARLDTAETNEATMEVRWEELGPGPVGEYLAVEDMDPSRPEGPYEPVNLEDPRLLARNGWQPSTGNPQFHQQMVYAVAMKTIEHFERALGRPVLWRPGYVPEKPFDDRQFIQRLKIHPHALRQANAFYSPREVALKFGYFESGSENADLQVPGSRVFTCLSTDIVVHETTHALLDGLHRRFEEPTNPDVLAFHEAFADIVALLQHFTLREVLEREIARTRGDLQAESLIGSLAVQFGHSLGRRGGLREAIGRMEDGEWRRFEPDPAELGRRRTPHSRGAILVAAVFDALLAIYKNRTADLVRIATGGPGVLPSGDIHPDLVGRLASEAAKSAQHVLTMCIRALDYLPPVDVTFFEYLRALITADHDLIRNDQHNYRVAFVEAFRRRGIYPEGLDHAAPAALRTLSVETLHWRGLDLSEHSRRLQAAFKDGYAGIANELKSYADACTYFKSREELFQETRKVRLALQRSLKDAFGHVPEFARELGLDPERKTFEVHDLRRALRTDPDGRVIPQVIVALTQSEHVGGRGWPGGVSWRYRGGSTLVVDLTVPEVKYKIFKRITSDRRRDRAVSYVRALAEDPLHAFLFGSEDSERFGALHTLAEGGE